MEGAYLEGEWFRKILVETEIYMEMYTLPKCKQTNKKYPQIGVFSFHREEFL